MINYDARYLELMRPYPRPLASKTRPLPPEDMEKWRETQASIHNQIKSELLMAAGVYGNRKAEAAWDIAWDEGHSSGYNEVLMWLEKLAPLLS